MSFVCSSKEKSSFVADELNVCDGRKNCTLIIHTCYLDDDNLENAKNFIDMIRRGRLKLYKGHKQRSTNLKKVEIYVSENEVKQKYFALRDFSKKFKGLPVDVHVVRSKGLFHSKAYALISCDASNKIDAGSLVIGSGNFTGNGLVKSEGNVESFLSSTDISDVRKFWEDTCKLKTTALEKYSLKVKSFEEGLVNSGFFLHLWTDNDYSKQKLAVKYDLTKESIDKQQAAQNELRQVDYNIDAETASHQYFSLPSRNLVRGWKKNYLIETYLGYWIPKSIFFKLCSNYNKTDFENFRKNIKADLYKQHEKNKEKIKEDYHFLLSNKVIKEMGSRTPFKTYDPSIDARRKIDELLENEYIMRNMFLQYEKFDFPYDRKSKEYLEKINRIYNDIINSAKFHSSKNCSMKAVLKAYKDQDLSAINEIKLVKSKANNI